MKYPSSVMMAAVFAVVLFSCNQNSISKRTLTETDLALSAISPGDSASYVKDSTDVVNEAEHLTLKRRFIRTAEINFKVQKVDEAVLQIENKVRELGGFVPTSSQQNILADSGSIPFSKDSILQTRHYVTKGVVILRVPDDRFDSLLAALRPLTVFTIQRDIHCEDAGLQILTNEWSYKRSMKSSRRIATDVREKGTKLTAIVGAEMLMQDQDKSAEDAKLSNLNLEDAVQLSTINLNIFQDPVILYTRTVREKEIDIYETPFAVQAGKAFSESWDFLKLIALSLIRLWSLIALILLGYLVAQKFIIPRMKIKSS